MTNTPRTDGWQLVLGLAVIALSAVTALGWIETRELQRRINRLEGVTPPTDGGPSSLTADAGPQFTSLDGALSIRDAASKGDPAAPVVIVEFSDFECPFCARHFRDTFRRIHDRYVATGKIKYVFRHLPLDEIHPNAFEAAEIAECSRRQAQFWPVHEAFFLQQRLLKNGGLRSIAVAAGADAGLLDACLQSGAARAQVAADVTDARRIGAGSTPLFVLGHDQGNGMARIRYSILGARTFATFETVLALLLDRNHEDARAQ
jgi:protein-disulfide isomerase